MSRYIEKLRVPVRLATRGDAPSEGWLFLATRTELREGPETLLDRLNAPTRILPFHGAADDAVHLVARAQVEWVMALPDVPAGLVCPPQFSATREEHVQVRLRSGECHDGVLAIEMPDEFNRLSDFLNGDEDFFALRTAAGSLLVHKASLVDVRVRPATARSRAA